MVVEQGSAFIPLTPSTAEGAVLAEVSWREGSTAPEAGGESSRALISAGDDSQVWGEPLLRWVDWWNPTSTLFTLDDTVEDMQ